MDEMLIQVKELLARGDLESAYKITSKIKNPYWKDYALRWIAEAYALRSSGRAVEIASEITTDSIHDEVFRNLSYLFSRDGNFKLAIETAEKIRNQFLKKKALKSVSNMLAKVIVESGSAGISLGELGLEEEDIESLKPLPKGIVLKDGKLMPGAEILRLKGDVKMGIVPRLEKPPKPSQAPEFKPLGGSKKNYLLGYFMELEERVEVEDLKKWAELTDEPLRSWILERTGLIYLKIGDRESAKELYHRVRWTRELGKELAFSFIETPEIGVEFLKKTPKSPARLLFIWELARRGTYDEMLYQKALDLENDKYKFARVLKFLAFELLEESKRKRNENMRRLSKKLFKEGVRLQREFELELLKNL
jgi:hypothetical protein